MASNFERRKGEIELFLRKLGNDARELSEKFYAEANKVGKADETLEEPLADAMLALQNFLGNVGFSKASIWQREPVPPRPNATRRNDIMIKRIFLAIAVLLPLLWAAGTVFIVENVTFRDGACRAPFYTYAFTWPLWRVMPMSVLEWSQDEALKWCDD